MFFSGVVLNVFFRGSFKCIFSGVVLNVFKWEGDVFYSGAVFSFVEADAYVGDAFDLGAVLF